MVHRLMTEKEKAAITMQAIALEKAGKKEEAMALSMTVPMPPFLAKFAKDHGDADYLRTSGWNLAEAEAEFGQDWLSK